MGIKVLGFLLLLAGIAWLIGYLMRYFQREGRDSAGSRERSPGFNFLQVACSVALSFVGLFVLLAANVIPAGHRGVVLLWGGEVENRVVDEGLVFVVPMVEKVVDVDVRVQAHEFKNIDAASKEMQSVKLSGNVNWRFDAQYVNWIYQNIGASKDFVDKILDKSLQDFLKEVTPKYSINEILPKRSDIRQGAVAALSDSLGRYHITINDIYIADVQFSAEYMAAIERQQVAERQVTTEKNILEQKKIQAEQVNIAASGEANAAATRAEGQKRAAILQAEGQATAISTVADSQAHANEVVNKTLTEAIIRYALVQKIGGDVKVIILPSGQQFILGPEVLGK